MFDKLKPHLGHKVTISWYGQDSANPDDICIECVDCNEVLISAQTFEEIEKAMNNRYNAAAKELFAMYLAFRDNGFTSDQAFELVSGYIRQSTYEYLVHENKRARTVRNDELLRKRLRTLSEKEKKDD